MRHRFMELQQKATAMLNGAHFVHLGDTHAAQVHPVQMDALKRVRDNATPNDTRRALVDRVARGGFSSRKGGA